MRYIMLVVMVLLLSSSTTRADVVFHEEFDEPWGWWGPDNQPTGWQINHFGEMSTPWYQNQGSDSFAQTETGYPLDPMSEDLFKDDIDCADYENLDLSFWLWIDWWDYDYPGAFLVYGSNDQFNDHCITLLTISSPNDFYDQTVHFDISDWADGQHTVGVWFRVEGQNLDVARVDSVHIEGDYRASVQAESLGKIKAIFL